LNIDLKYRNASGMRFSIQIFTFCIPFGVRYSIFGVRYSGILLSLVDTGLTR